MTVNRISLHRIDNAIDGDFAVHQVGKGRSVIEFEIGDLSLLQAELFKSVVGKIPSAIFSFRINVVDIVRMGYPLHCVFPDDCCLAHAERIDKEPCCHCQGCENPAYFQGFGFGLGLFAAAFRAVVSVCHRSYLLSVLFFSICSSFCCQKENLLLTGHPPLPGIAPRSPNSYQVYLKRCRHGEIHPGAAYFIIVEVLLEGESYA